MNQILIMLISYFTFSAMCISEKAVAEIADNKPFNKTEFLNE